jgi:outer membrane protein assembly factor BamE
MNAQRDCAQRHITLTSHSTSKMITHLSKPLKLIALATLVSLQGCGGYKPYKAPITQGVVINPEQVELLQVGLHKTQVRQILGPTYGEGSVITDHWEYVFYSTDPNQHAQSMDHVVIWFDKEGYVTRWAITN